MDIGASQFLFLNYVRSSD